MSNESLYLKPNAYIEPLINQWYAWPLLVAPHTLAMVIANLHLKIMESYIKSPMMHANAVKNPKMLGGPFIDLPGNQAAVIRDLMEKTKTEQAHMIRFAEAVKELDSLLSSEAKGYTLIHLYDKLPQELRGYIELGYDLNNQPSIRFLERMLYRSPYYREENQGFALSLTERDYRPFVLSTPRIPGPKSVHYSMPFRSEAIDRLFSMRETPQPLDYVADLIPEDAEQRAFFESLFTTEAPDTRGHDRDSLGDQVRIKYFGHAVLLIETKDVSILTDPLVSYDVENNEVPRFTYEDLPETIDYAVITHSHQDHVMFETLLQLRQKIKCIVVPKCNGGSLQDPSLKLVLEHTGFKNVVELEEMETLPLPGGSLTGMPFFGEHADLHIRSKLGYYIKLNDKTIACAADSNNLSPEIFEYVREHLGSADYMFLGMECQGAPLSWLYGPLLTKPLERKMDQSRRFDGSDCLKGMEMVDSLKSKSVYVYAMGQEPWLTFISSLRYTSESKPIVESNKLVEECRRRGLESERLFGKKVISV